MQTVALLISLVIATTLILLGILAFIHSSSSDVASTSSPITVKSSEATVSHGHDAPRTPPHIVLVIADDLGFHDVGYHGSFIETPTIDSLASDGVRLENYYVQPVCSPTRCQLLSGRHLIHMGRQHSVFFSEQPIGLPLDSPTLADKLQKSGYSTNLVGKWHVGYYTSEYLPNSRGFDYFFGKLQGHGDHYNHMRPYKKKNYLDLWQNDEPVGNETGHYSTHLFTDKAVQVVQNHNENKPLFLMVSYQAPHSPLQVPERYKDRYESKVNDKKRKAFAGMVTAVDEGIANVTRALKEKGLWDNTLFIFSTDNGGDPKKGGNNYPLRGGKRSLWEGGIRGLAFVTGGARMGIARGHVNRNLVHVSDWFPTLIAGVAGSNLDDTKPLTGINQWPGIITADAPPARDMILHNIDPMEKLRGPRIYPKQTFDTRKRAAIRVGDLKLLTGPVGKGVWAAPPEKPWLKSKRKTKRQNKVWLFNITADPNEQNDLSRERPEDVARLLSRLKELDATSVPVFYPNNDPLADPAKHGNVWGPWW